MTDKAADCVNWLEKWMQQNTDMLPHKFLSEQDAKDVVQWPACYDVKSIYTMYARDMQASADHAYSYDGFCKILRSDRFKHCKRADQNSEFKCKDCLSLKKDLEWLKRHNSGNVNDSLILAKEV
jgi:hypothetical protein